VPPPLGADSDDLSQLTWLDSKLIERRVNRNLATNIDLRSRLNDISELEIGLASLDYSVNSSDGELDDLELEMNSLHGPELEVISPVPECEKINGSDNIDPDQNLFRITSWSSNYVSPENFQRTLLKDLSLKTLTVLHINCRSLLHKTTEIQDLLEKTRPTIVALTETWLDDNLSDCIQIPGYNFVGKARDKGRGGGVAFLIENNCNYLVYNLDDKETKYESFESLLIKIELKNCTTIIGVIYRPPGLGLPDFQKDFDLLNSKLEGKNKEIILLGDFNIDLLKVNDHKDTNIFYNSLIALHYLPAITKPTRITKNTKSLIDNIFCTNWNKLLSASIIISDISDHLPIIAQFSNEKYSIKESANAERRVITASSQKNFLICLKQLVGIKSSIMHE